MRLLKMYGLFPELYMGLPGCPTELNFEIAILFRRTGCRYFFRLKRKP